VPSDAEWTTLTDFLGGESVAGGAMKSTATQPTPGGWNAPNTGATNSSGFTGLPGGSRGYGGWFDTLGTSGFWWSSSDAGSGNAFLKFLSYAREDVGGGISEHRSGSLVRCVKDVPATSLATISTSSPTVLWQTGASTGGDITDSGGGTIFNRGVAYGTLQSPTISGMSTSDGTGMGVFFSTLSGLTASTLYYVRAYATNSVGTAYGNEVSFTTFAPPQPCPGAPSLTDIDGNTYTTVQIGTQCWTQSNLKVSKYRNGDNISNITDTTAWSLTTTTSTGAWCNYSNDAANDTLYGKLYNWYAVNDSRGLCPTGWHVPSNAEWTTLTVFLGGYSVAGGAMKSTATQPTPGGWNAPNTGATNVSVFTGLPGGYRDSGGGFVYLGTSGYWWSSSGAGSGDALFYSLSRNYEYVRSGTGHLSRGSSVRCVKDVPGTSLATISTSSPTVLWQTGTTTGGDVTSDGGAAVTARGVAYGTAQNPTTANSTTSDGAGTGVFTSTLTGLTASTLYYVRAYATNYVGTAYGNEESFTTLAQPQPCPGAPSITDIDGNTYNTVQIGTQCWTQSNLKVSKYRNGDNIPTGLNNSQWGSTTSGAYAIHNNNSANDALYGKLYNWYAVNDSRGLCPTGWHVPSDGEWTTLTDFLGGESVAGGAMKTTTGWNYPNSGATNSSGFTGLPGDHRSFGGGCYSFGTSGFWWSSSDAGSGSAWYRGLGYYYAYANRGNFYPRYGFSVRCLKNTLPQVNTTSVTNITPSTALATGEVISEGDQNTTRGFCYSTTSNPTISNDTTMNGTGLGVYSGTLQNLTPLTTYYVRAYATNSVGTSYGNELSFTTNLLTIGTNYTGGIVFYLDSTGQHGLVCAPSDQGSFQWGCYGTDISGTSTAFGTGMANTLTIVNGCYQRPIAASVCNDLVLNGYNDWYLPSLDELSLMYQNLRTFNLGNFLNNWYWSSSQYASGSAWLVNFSYAPVGFTVSLGYSIGGAKDSNGQVRAVRAF
jgi:uncharacterized protein (TIGR02145 family)